MTTLSGPIASVKGQQKQTRGIASVHSFFSNCLSKTKLLLTNIQPHTPFDPNQFNPQQFRKHKKYYVSLLKKFDNDYQKLARAVKISHFGILQDISKVAEKSNAEDLKRIAGLNQELFNKRLNTVEGRLALLDTIIPFKNVGLKSIEDIYSEQGIEYIIKVAPEVKRFSLLNGISQKQKEKLIASLFYAQQENPSSFIYFLKSFGWVSRDAQLLKLFYFQVAHYGFNKTIFKHFYRKNNLTESIDLYYRIKSTTIFFVKTFFSMVSILTNRESKNIVNKFEIDENILAQAFFTQSKESLQQIKKIIKKKSNLSFTTNYIGNLFLTGGILSVAYYFYLETNKDAHHTNNNLFAEHSTTLLVNTLLDETITYLISINKLEDEYYAIKEFKMNHIEELRKKSADYLTSEIKKYTVKRKEYGDKILQVTRVRAYIEKEETDKSKDEMWISLMLAALKQRRKEFNEKELKKKNINQRLLFTDEKNQAIIQELAFLSNQELIDVINESTQQKKEALLELEQLKRAKIIAEEQERQRKHLKEQKPRNSISNKKGQKLDDI